MSIKPPRRPRRRELSRPARSILELGAILSCLILAAALLMSVYTGGLNAHSVHTHRLIADLYRLPQGILLVTFLGALLVEDRLS